MTSPDAQSSAPTSDDRPLKEHPGQIAGIAMREIGAIIGIAGVALGLLAFLMIADEMQEGEFASIDRSVMLALRNSGDLSQPIGPHWLVEGMADITALGGYSVLTLLMAMVFFYLLATRRIQSAFLTIFAVLSGTLMSTMLKMFFGRDRPDLVPHLVDATSASFPSGHSMLSAVSYLTLGVLLAQSHDSKRLRFMLMGYAVLITVLVGCSRVYLGVHWPTDVLAGWSFGAAWASLWWVIGWGLRRWRSTRQQAEPTD
ncbi:phosphatase PAP2 family protein [Parvularcula sp. LCG005]|uniref:phosphatase PAP2 family protein n=1 Tax=Parvularcula sp. LCG005 TaxID=3078805 RepID=UPI002941E832|nr:phosphatase PAP2 family protein [Parvularcula sp. LCG005]WOI53237.1 phosphatase PAP2 family protein [Parvularcula sp. LCG005]